MDDNTEILYAMSFITAKLLTGPISRLVYSSIRQFSEFHLVTGMSVQPIS